MIFELDFRDHDTGGAVTAGVLTEVGSGVSGPAALDLLRIEPAVTILTHGFNINRPEGRDKLRNLARDLPAASNSAIVYVLWPGDHWVGAISYPFEGDDADDTAAMLVRFLQDAQLPATVPISFVTHSLGARVALETMKALAETHDFRQVCLMAAAVDDNCLSDPNLYRHAVETASRVAVLHSREDEVLRFAYPIGDLFQAFLFWRDSAGLALGYHGPRPSGEDGLVPSTVIDFGIPDQRGSDHGDYLWAPPDVPQNDEHRSAASYANAVLANEAHPVYPEPATKPPVPQSSGASHPIPRGDG
jgi:hypothetical protein